jgi:hypothetical protein
MRRYRAAPYYFGTWAIIAGVWMTLLVVMALFLDFSPPWTAALAAGAAALLALGLAAIRSSITDEEVPDTATEAVALADAREAPRAPFSARSPGGQRRGPA